MILLALKQASNRGNTHFVKSVLIRNFSRIRTEYGKILRISPYSVQTQENTDQNNSKYGHFSRSDTNEFHISKNHSEDI